MMQGQGNDSSAYPGKFYLDYGSNGINLRWDQGTIVPVDASVDDHQLGMGWMGQSNSCVNNQTLVRFHDLLPENGLPSDRVDQSTSHLNTQTPVLVPDLLAGDSLLSSSVDGLRTDQSLEERHSGLITPFQHSVSTNLRNGQLVNRPLPLQQASSSNLPQSIDLNGMCDGHGNGGTLKMATSLCINPFKLGGSDEDQNPLGRGSSSSSPPVISSGITGYVVEENEGGEGRSSYGRHLPCKRRAPEDAYRQLFLGVSSRSTRQAITTRENGSRRLNLSTPMNSRHNVRHSEQLGTGPLVGLEAPPIMHQQSGASGSGLGSSTVSNSDVHQIMMETGEVEPSQRNICLRRTLNQQDTLPGNLVSQTTRNSIAQLPSQQAIPVPFDYLPNTRSMAGIVHPNLPMQQPVHVSCSSENLLPFQWNTITKSRTGLPSNLAYPTNGADALPLEHMLTNLNFVPGTNSSRNIASNSRNTSSSHVHQPSASIWFPQGNMAQQYAQRISDIGNHTEPQGQGSYYPRHLGVYVAARERELSARGGNVRPSQLHLGSRLTAQPERQTGIHPELVFHPLTGTQRRTRLVSEVRNALALVRRGGSLPFEDVMVIDRSVFFGVPEEPDQHEDMRFDVDNMSYEELLALEERIGNVCTGLGEDAIEEHMKRQKYEAIAGGSSLEDEPCCICQEDYANGEDLGKLECGHDFHFNCIKQWLVQKNSCPVCKMTGLEVRDC